MLLDQVSYIKVAFNIMINGKVIYNRIPNASRTHPEGIPKENKATRYQKTLTKILLLSKSQGIKLLNPSRSQG